MAHVLVVDDDVMLADMLAAQLHRIGHRAEMAATLAQGIRLAQEGSFDVIFLDVQLPDGNGLEEFSRFAGVSSTPEIIIMTGSGDPDGAKKAIESGAWSYLEKPHVRRDLLLPLTRALQYRDEKKKINVVPVALKRDSLVGKSPALLACIDQLALAAQSEANVLITGKTGTGKEVFARTIHGNSRQAKQAFVVVDCAALAENLIESTLFGHVRGAFTGADRTSRGLIAMADGGTLFLDEVGEMPEGMQKKFLRVLQEHRFRPVGGAKEEVSNFRVIAATNRNLDRDVAAGRFRADLLFRLRSHAIHLPPLKERKEDIRLLTRFFLTRLCDRFKKEYKGIAEEFFEHLQAHDWPGNVRELQQTMEQVFAGAANHPTLFAYHLPDHFRLRMALEGINPAQSGKTPPAMPTGANCPVPWRAFKADMEKAYLNQLLAHAQGSIKEACTVSGLSRARLYQLFNQYDLYPSQNNLGD